ncbi:MAG: 30S ribosomal protein S20 [Deltaproteobacteria bacterium]|nr:30S ribosomal protein S20 [Deltaproteobacteria bacterium]
MANVDSAKKRIRQTERRTARNKHVRSTVRGTIKKVREAIEAGTHAAAATSLADAIQKIDAAVSKGVFHKNAGSRYVSRLSSQVAALKK